MAKDKKPFGKPIAPTDSIPDYLKEGNRKTVKFGNHSIGDYQWLGDDGQLKAGSVVEYLSSPEALLRIVVEAIVAANPMQDPSAGMAHADRVEAALKALLGRPSKRGRRESLWYEPLLRQMAEEYLSGFYGFSDSQNSLNALADSILTGSPDYEKLNFEGKEGRRRTLARKFIEHKDGLLSSVSLKTDYGHQEILARAHAAIAAIAELGIKIKPDCNG